MLGEIVLDAPTIFEAQTIGLPMVAHLGCDNRIAGEKEFAAHQLEKRSEFDLVGFTAARRKPISSDECQAEPVTLAR